MTTDQATILGWLADHRGDAEAFLAELVRQASDNPPGDCAPHASVAAALLESMDLAVAEANGHRADERLRLDDLHRATDVVALALADLLAGPLPAAH